MAMYWVKGEMRVVFTAEESIEADSQEEAEEIFLSSCNSWIESYDESVEVVSIYEES